MPQPVVHIFPCPPENYGLLLHDPESGETVAIDTPDADEILRQADLMGWRITQVWNTHWHNDHTGGNAAIKARTGCTITGPARETRAIPEIDRAVSGGETVQLGRHTAYVLATPGHTLGHIAYHLPGPALAFVGDTLFSLGCGRRFEGEAADFWDSLRRLRDLPPDTAVYCAHEYTAGNARFALTIDGDNPALQARAREVEALRAEGRSTIPTTIASERAANPFLRADDAALMARLGAATPVAAFDTLRKMKDSFR